MKTLWYEIRRKISLVLIVNLIATNVVYLMPTNANALEKTMYIPECVVEDDYIDAGMFYMPYASFEIDENDENNKRIFKVKRKGNIDKTEKVKLTMVDMTGKYNRDYKIRVIGSTFLSEKVKNVNKSMSVDEFIGKSDYSEYNYSDAIVDGSINEENQMSDEEKANYEISDDEKEKLLNDANEILDELSFDGQVEELNSGNKKEKENTEKNDELVESIKVVDELDDEKIANEITENELVKEAKEEVKVENNFEETEETIDSDKKIDEEVDEEINEAEEVVEKNSEDDNKTNVDDKDNIEENKEDEKLDDNENKNDNSEVSEEKDEVVSGFTKTENETNIKDVSNNKEEDDTKTSSEQIDNIKTEQENESNIDSENNIASDNIESENEKIDETENEKEFESENVSENEAEDESENDTKTETDNSLENIESTENTETETTNESESESETGSENETNNENTDNSVIDSESLAKTKLQDAVSATEVVKDTTISEENTNENSLIENNAEKIVEKKIEKTTEKEVEKESEKKIGTDIEETPKNMVATDSEFGTTNGENDLLIISTESDASEEIKFETKLATMSLTDAWELATGLKNDRKQVVIDRDEDTLGLSPNSIENNAFINDGIKVVEDELNSAYVELNFKPGQVEKLIEITIINDKKYLGERQVGFNLSGIDGSEIAGMYSSMTLIIKDDEEVEPTYINFTKNTYYPKDGYVTVDIERSGNLSGLATCMIDSEDITAIEHRDYSKVHAELIFGMGVNKRTVKIPIMSININAEASFKLKLQEAKGALIGDNNEAICKIRKTDENFKIVTEKLLKASGDKNESQLFGSGANNSFNDDIVLKPSIDDGEKFGAGGDDYTLTSIKLADPIAFKNEFYSFSSKNANSNSYHNFINNDKGMEYYIENKDFGGETASMKHGVSVDSTRHYDYAGFRLNWSCDNENAHILFKNYDYSSDSWNVLYDRNREKWDTKDSDFFFNQNETRDLWFAFYRYDGMWRTSPKIRINSITPILRMFKVRLRAADVPQLINETGQKSTNHKYTQYAVTSIDGAMSDHTTIGYSGKTITVKLDNSINNPFYIKELKIVKGNNSYTVANNYNENTTSISFRITNNMLANCKSFIDLHNREGGGKTGEFTLQPVLGTKRAVVKIEKDDRVNIKIWNNRPSATNNQYETYYYNVGDVLHFTSEMKNNAGSLYQCDGLNMYRVKPYSPQYITLRRPTDGSSYFPLDLNYSEIRIVPSVSQKNNSIVVRVPKTSYDRFDKGYGLFKNSTRIDNSNYYEYVISNESDKICGNYFDMKARCSDSSYSPVWYENNKQNVKYMQDAYYFLGSEQNDDNIIYLTAEKADNKEYSLSGIAYYEEVPIGGNIVDRSWQAVKNAGIIVDETHFAYTNDKGEFSVMPGKGKSGYYKKYKIICNGETKYGTVKLNQNNSKTTEYEIEYEDGVKKIIKDGYDVKIDELLVKNIDITHPHILNVKSTNRYGTSFNAVYINDDISNLTATIQRKDDKGNFYKYTYNDENGVLHTEDEDVKRVEFVVIDVESHKTKYVVEATRSNADKTEWTASYVFKRGNYNDYKSGDKLYVRVVTNRKVGDGKGLDINTNTRKDVPIFQETTYAGIYTNFQFIEEAERQPYIVDFKFPADKEGSYRLPIIGGLSTMINALGMSFGIRNDGDRIRLFIGKKFNGGGNRYMPDGKTASDTGYNITLSNFKEGWQDMIDNINDLGTKRLKTMTLGIPTWTFEPIIGVYFEFMLYHDPNAVTTSTFEYTGGGGYIGAILDLRFTFYFLVVGVPCYVGGEVTLTLVGEFGVAVDDGEHIALNDPSQAFFDELFEKTHFEFIFRATLVTSAYVGVGIAGTLGVRGGFELTLNFIYNPFVTKRYKELSRPVGFSVTGAIKIWIDAVLLSVPVPIYTWLKPKNFGYFEDVEKYEKEHGGKSLFGNANDGRSEETELKPRPRNSEESEFVYNNSNDDLFGGTYEEVRTRTLINNAYDDAAPELMSIGNDKFLLVYLDDDKTRNDLERTVLKWTMYDRATDTWTQPREVDENNETADFTPVLCDCGDKILLAWCSRPVNLDENVEKKELLKNMEVYATFFDKGSLTFRNVERLTNDEAYDYNLKVTYESGYDRVYLAYIKKPEVGDINTKEDLLNTVQPEVNGSYIMYMLYEDPANYDPATTSTAHWIRDYYYDSEMPNASAMTEEDKRAYIDTMKGQRFVVPQIDLGNGTIINNPNFSDFAIENTDIYNYTVASMSEIIQNILGRTLDELNAMSITELDNLLNDHSMELLTAFLPTTYLVGLIVVDEDGNPKTKNDTELYLTLYNDTDDVPVKSIRLTNNNVSDIMPKIVSNDYDTYIFWIQNESMIKMLSLSSIISKADEEDSIHNELITGNVSIMTTDKLLLSDKINNYYPFTDDNDNVYLIWQQQSSKNLTEEQTGEVDFKADLYMSGLVCRWDGNAAIKSWSNPIKLTDNNKLNSLPVISEFSDGRLLFINNQYNLTSNGDKYVISDSKLQEIIFKPASSLEFNKVKADVDTIYDNGSAKYKVGIELINAGVNAAEGFTYDGTIKYDNTILTNVTGSSNEVVMPGSTIIIGEDINDTEIATNPIYITLTKEQLHHLDKVKLHMNVKENQIGDAGKTIDTNLVDVKEKFAFVLPEEGKERVADGELKAVQDGNNFVISGTLINSGDIDSKGNEKICVAVNDENYNKPILTTDYINLVINEQMAFNITVDGANLSNISKGYEDLVLWVENDDGERLSNYEIVTANANKPFNFAVNNQKESLTIREGEKLNLKATYEPSKRYRNATVLYTVNDKNIANVDNGVLTGLTKGTTVLNLTTEEFGGVDNIVINVIEAEKRSSGVVSRSGGGGGGGGYISNIPLDNYNPSDISKVNNIPNNFTRKTLSGSENIEWQYMPTTNDWTLSYEENGMRITAANTFIDVPTYNMMNQNMPILTYDRYYFDTRGYMIFGWLNTQNDNNWYYFEAQNTKNRGKMIMNTWKEVAGKWYYFGIDGVMYKNQMTPDGYFVNETGEWVR